MSSYAWTDKRLKADAHERAAKRLAEFHVETIVDNEHVRLFRCWDGKSSDCSFRVAEYAANLVISGDMGEWMFVRECRMLDWAKTAVRDDSYFAEKLMACREGSLKEFWPEAVQEYIADAIKECEDVDRLKKWKGLLADYRYHEDQGDDGREFYRLLYESGLCDGCDMPTIHRYSWRFHWIQRAIGWLCEQLAKQKVPA